MNKEWKYKDGFIRDETGNAIADPHLTGHLTKEQEAENARLMATSLELLEACEAIDRDLQTKGRVSSFTIGFLGQTIKKARGE